MRVERLRKRVRCVNVILTDADSEVGSLRSFPLEHVSCDGLLSVQLALGTPCGGTKRMPRGFCGGKVAESRLWGSLAFAVRRSFLDLFFSLF